MYLGFPAVIRLKSDKIQSTTPQIYEFLLKTTSFPQLFHLHLLSLSRKLLILHTKQESGAGRIQGKSDADSEHSHKMTDIENDIKKELEKQTTSQLVY